MKNPKQFAKLFNYGEDIGLANNRIFLSVKLYLCAGVLTNDNLVANLNGHNYFLAVYEAAGAYCYYLRHLRVLQLVPADLLTAMRLR